MNLKQDKRAVGRLLVWQFAVTALISLVLAMVSGSQAGNSALLGGFINLLPNACFASIVFRYQGARDAKKIVNSLYKGEAVKILLTLLLFAVVFSTVVVNPLVLFLTFIVSQMVVWFAPLILNHK